MSSNWHLNRRAFLRGLGTAIALPLFDAMVPARLGLAGASKAEVPRRIAFMYVPNGAHMPDWTPTELGTNFDFPTILKPLETLRKDLIVISGLAHQKAKPNGDGPGDHARSVATFLTGRQAYKTAGKDIRIGISVDQLVAGKIGDKTRLPSLELGCERSQRAGKCDSGYSCAYTTNLSWRSESTPVPKEINPRQVFNRLFGAEDAAEAAKAQDKRQRLRKSVIDFVLEDAKILEQRLGIVDRRKLDEYLYGVRELEQRIERGAREGQTEIDDGIQLERPLGVPGDFGEHLRIMGDLMALAFQTDQTRVATLMFANAGSNRSYPNLEITEGHHTISHHKKDKKKQANISKINHFHAQQFAYVIDKMKKMPEGNGSVLDNTMVVYGSGIGDGDRHNHNELPILLAGGKNCEISLGRHVRYETNTPLTNLYLSMLDRMGVTVESFGDSSGRLDQLVL